MDEKLVVFSMYRFEVPLRFPQMDKKLVFFSMSRFEVPLRSNEASSNA